MTAAHGARAAPAARPATVRKASLTLANALLWLALAGPARPAIDPQTSQHQAQAADLSNETLEDLMNTEVTSASKKEQKLSQVAAAIFVITQEDIRRSGATNIPDLLRMVPGVNVAQINANTWAVAVRGFNEQFSDALLVLLDGRIVYTPTFSGVYWDTLDVPLEDIDRIEVIRGPGASIWGVNAMNGVINIVTKKAGDTQGVLAAMDYGTFLHGLGTVQFGAPVGKNGDFRFFTKYVNTGDFIGADGRPAEDASHILRSGTRADFQLSAKDSFTVLGEMYTGETGVLRQDVISISPPLNASVTSLTDLSGGDILARWTEKQSDQSETSVQFSFDRYRRNSFDEIDELRDTYQIDFQHHVQWLPRNDVVWGVSYRNSVAQTHGNLNLSFDPAQHTSQFTNIFVQDAISIVPERVVLTLGGLGGWEDYTGYGFQPMGRILWAPAANRTVWFGVSHAHRNPSFLETSARQNLEALAGPGGEPELISSFGNPHQKLEQVVAWELGYRQQVANRVSVDLETFFDRYSDLGSSEPETPFTESTPPPTHLVIPSVNGNGLYGETHGAEFAGNWQVNSRWSLRASYALLEMHIHRDATSQDTTTPGDIEGSDPRNRATLRSHVNFWRGVSWDASAEFVDRLWAQGIPAYTRVDTSLNWQAGERFTVGLVGQNLLRNLHREFNDPFGTSVSDEIKRSGYIRLSWRF